MDRLQAAEVLIVCCLLLSAGGLLWPGWGVLIVMGWLVAGELVEMGSEWVRRWRH